MKNFFSRYKRLIVVLIPALVGILYIILCACNLQQSVWFDESYGAYLARFSFSDIWSLTSADVHPPLYYFLLKIWSSIFGYTDFAMRFMSVFFGAIAIIFAWVWLKRKYGVKPALLAILLMSLSPMFIRYGQEMRMYTLAAAIVFAATFVLQLAIDTKKRRFWLIYGALMSLGMWTHYFTALIWIAQLSYLAYLYKKQIFQSNIILSYALAVLLYLPWLPCFLTQTTVVQRGFWIADPNLSTVASFFTETLFYSESGAISGWPLILALIILGFSAFMIVKFYKKALLLSFMAFIPPILLILLSLPPLTPMFVDRYLVNSSVCFSLLLGICLASMIFTQPKISRPRQSTKHKKMLFCRFCLALLFVGGSIFGLYNVYSLGNYNKSTNSKSDAKSLFQTVSEIAELGEPIIATSAWLYYDLAFYGNAEHPVYFIDESTNYEYGSLEPLRLHDYGKILDLDEFLEGQSCAWYLGDLPETGDLEFPRTGWSPKYTMTLSVNINQSDYQAIEFCKD